MIVELKTYEIGCDICEFSQRVTTHEWDESMHRLLKKRGWKIEYCNILARLTYRRLP